MKIKKSISMIIILLLIILQMMPTVAQATTIGKVNNLKSETKGSTVYFRWDKVSNVDGYDIYINISNRGYQYIGSVNKNVAPIIGFQDGYTYLVKVRAYKKTSNGAKQTGAFSNAVEINKKNNSEELEKVKTLSVSQNSNHVTLNWANVSNATGYEVWAGISGQKYSKLGVVEGSNNAIITGCESGKTYQFKVRAYRKEGSKIVEYGEYSPEKKITIKTNQNEEEPSEDVTVGKVKNLEVNEVSENKATIEWSKVANADGYEVYLAKGNGKYQYVKTVTKTNATLSKLEEDTKYYVKVRAFKKVNGKKQYGKYSDEEKFYTDEAETKVEKVRNLTTKVKNNSVELNWSKIYGVDGYRIYMSKNNTKNFTYQGSTISTFSEPANLEYNTTYYFKVTAYVIENGKMIEGEASTIKKVTTPKQSSTKVPQVKNVKANVIGDAVYLSWDKVPNAVKYEIAFTVPGIGGSIDFTVYTNSRKITGLTDKKYNYTAKVRAYKYINGKLVPGEYSTISYFKAK